MGRVAVLMAEGYEEGETLTIVDLLRRGGLECHTFSFNEEFVRGMHDMYVKADKLFNDEIKKSEDIIKTNSYKVLLDKNVRRKAKIAIIMFACSKKMMIKVYKHVDRWK